MSPPDVLLAAFARHLGLPAEAARPVLQDLLDGLRARLDAEGEATLDGIGRFRQDGGEASFEADPALLTAVNAPFAGLPLITSSSLAPPAGSPSTEIDEATPALFSVPLESADEDAETAAGASSASSPHADADDAPIAPLPSAPKTATEPTAGGERAAATEDAFAAPPETSPPPEPPVRDLSSETGAETLDHPIAVPFAPAGDLGDEDTAPPAETPPPQPTGGEEDPTDEAATAETPVEEDDGMETLTDGVWAPSDPASPDHPLGAASEPFIEDAEFDVVDRPAPPEDVRSEESADDPVAPELEASLSESVTLDPAGKAADAEKRVAEESEAGEPDEVAVPTVGVVGAVEAAPDPTVTPTPVGRTAVPGLRSEGARAPEAAPERKRSRGALLWLPLLALLLALLLFWPSGSDRPDDKATALVVTPPPVASVPDSAALAAAPTDSSEAALPGEAPTPEPPAAPPTGEAAASPLRGSGGMNPARGNATWVLTSIDQEGAERLASRYRQQGYRTDVFGATVNGRTVHRVAVGQFGSFEEAIRYRSALPPDAPSDAWVLVFE